MTDSCFGNSIIPVRNRPRVSPTLKIRKVQTGTNHFVLKSSFVEVDRIDAQTPGNTDRVTTIILIEYQILQRLFTVKVSRQGAFFSNMMRHNYAVVDWSSLGHVIVIGHLGK